MLWSMGAEAVTHDNSVTQGHLVLGLGYLCPFLVSTEGEWKIKGVLMVTNRDKKRLCSSEM